jgi:hypothetical protein
VACHDGGGRHFWRSSGGGGEITAVLAISMKLDEMAITMALAAGGAWIGTIARQLRNERRRPSWQMVILELPGVIVCGLGAGGLVVAMGFENPLTIAGAGAVAGHIGAQAFVQLLLALVKKKG